MKATLATACIALAALAFAALQYSQIVELRTRLADSEAQRAQLLVQIDEGNRRQSAFEARIDRLEENLQSSSRQLLVLADSLQEAREMLAESNPAAPVAP